MNHLNQLIYKNNITNPVFLSKIALLLFTAFFLFSNPIPFYEAADPYIYALTTINLVENGQYEFTNPLLSETGDWVLVPQVFSKTIHDTAVPDYNPGLPVFSTLFYSLGGVYGLLYAGPIFTLLSLIVIERVSTKLFNGTVGLFVLGQFLF